MRPSPRFKFTLLHGIVLVATCAAFFSMRWIHVRYQFVFTNAVREWQSSHSILLLLSHARRMFLDTPPFVAIGTISLLGLCFCHPRPTLRRLSCQPGFVACFAASFVILLSFSLDLLQFWSYDHVPSIYAGVGRNPDVEFERTIEQSQQYPGYAVGAAWGLLWLGRRWRSNSGRLDAIGRALGYYWLGFIVLGKFMSYFY